MAQPQGPEAETTAGTDKDEVTYDKPRTTVNVVQRKTGDGQRQIQHPRFRSGLPKRLKEYLQHLTGDPAVFLDSFPISANKKVI